MTYLKERRSAWIWLILRLYVGVQWLEAGWEKLTGEKAFDATGFIKGAIDKAAGAHPAVQPWYAAFLDGFALPNVGLFNFLIPWGEFLVGLSLILGFATLFATFMGMFMNLNFMLAGTTSTNPILFTLGIFIMMGGAYAGYLGVDYWFRPLWRNWVARWTGAGAGKAGTGKPATVG